MTPDHQIDIRFVHGLGGAPAEFDELRTRLPASWHTGVVDLPGHAHTVAPSNGESVAAIADLLAARLTPPTSNTVLVGHSSGGVLLLDAVSRGLITPGGLVLIDSNVPIGVAARRDKDRKAARASRTDWWRSFLASTLESTGHRTGSATRAAIEASIQQVPRSTIITIWRAVLAYDATDAWTTCPCPVLYLRTTRSISYDDLAAARARAGVSGAPVEIVSLPRALGHYPHRSDPGRVANTVAAFVRELVIGKPIDGHRLNS